METLQTRARVRQASSFKTRGRAARSQAAALAAADAVDAGVEGPAAAVRRESATGVLGGANDVAVERRPGISVIWL